MKAYFAMLLGLGVAGYFPSAAGASEGGPNSKDDIPERADFLLVSDLDDTVKITHSRNMFAAALNAYLSSRAFQGMSRLYNEWLDEVPYAPGPKRLHIITGSPTFLAHQVRSFMRENAFPAAGLILRDMDEDPGVLEFKVRKIRELASKTERPFILVGDDTQKDPDAYAEFARDEVGGRVLATYIHRVNKKTRPLFEGQHPFYTAFDIAVSEWTAGRMSFGAALAVGREVLAAFRSRTGPQRVIPLFADCPEDPDRLGEAQPESNINPVLLEMRTKINGSVLSVCQNRTEPADPE